MNAPQKLHPLDARPLLGVSDTRPPEGGGVGWVKGWVGGPKAFFSGLEAWTPPPRGGGRGWDSLEAPIPPPPGSLSNSLPPPGGVGLGWVQHLPRHSCVIRPTPHPPLSPFGSVLPTLLLRLPLLPARVGYPPTAFGYPPTAVSTPPPPSAPTHPLSFSVRIWDPPPPFVFRAPVCRMGVTLRLEGGWRL